MAIPVRPQLCSVTSVQGRTYGSDKLGTDSCSQEARVSSVPFAKITHAQLLGPKDFSGPVRLRIYLRGKRSLAKSPAINNFILRRSVSPQLFFLLISRGDSSRATAREAIITIHNHHNAGSYVAWSVPNEKHLS